MLNIDEIIVFNVLNIKKEIVDVKNKIKVFEYNVYVFFFINFSI